MNKKTNVSKAKVIIDYQKNRIYLTFDSTVKKHDLQNIYTEIRFAVADLKPGFDVINDLSKATFAHLSGVTTFKRISDFLSSNEVGKVVRVITGMKGILFKQLSKSSEHINGYAPIYTSSVEEAEKLLDEAK
ncbi:MAG: hypothetical protein OCC45_14095 [Desulfotalea sp.]